MSRMVSELLAGLCRRFPDDAPGFRVFADAACALHEPREGLPDSAARLGAILTGLATLPDATPLSFREAPPARWSELRAVHDSGYLLALESALLSGRPYFMSPECPLEFGSGDAILAAAGMSLALGESLAEGASGFVLARPPGHHAGPAKAEGFCFLNNAALAVSRYWERKPGARVAVIDLDLHHGNGTQACLEDTPGVFFLSLHGDPSTLLYPNGGFASENRDTPAVVRDIPLPEGTFGATWLATLANALDELERFSPDAVVVSLGLDGHAEDPFKFFLLTDDDFVAALGELRRRFSGKPLGLLLEGGYSTTVLERLAPKLLAAVVVRW